MVDALRSAWRVLRPGGVVVDFQPAAVYQPRLAVVRDNVRREIGTFSRTLEPEVSAAHHARRRAIAEGWFAPVVSTHGAYWSRYGGPADLRWVLRENTNWRLEPSVRRRLDAALAGRRQGTHIEIRRSYSFAVLRKRTRTRPRRGRGASYP